MKQPSKLDEKFLCTVTSDSWDDETIREQQELKNNEWMQQIW